MLHAGNCCSSNFGFTSSLTIIFFHLIDLLLYFPYLLTYFFSSLFHPPFFLLFYHPIIHLPMQHLSIYASIRSSICLSISPLLHPYSHTSTYRRHPLQLTLASMCWSSARLGMVDVPMAEMPSRSPTSSPCTSKMCGCLSSQARNSSCGPTTLRTSAEACDRWPARLLMFTHRSSFLASFPWT